MYNFFKELPKRLKNEIGGKIEEKICYVHVHKCAGTSISSAIREHYIGLDIRRDRELISIDAEASTIASESKRKSAKEIYEFREKLLMYFLELRNTRFVSGHFLFSEKIYKKFNDRFAFIIGLRDPIERWLSHYFFNRYKKKKYGMIYEDFDGYLTSDMGSLNGREYIQFLCGLADKDLGTEEALECAKYNLRFFDVIGFLEYKEEFVEKFNRRFGAKLILRQRNKNPKSEFFKDSFLSIDNKNKINALCQPDIELYKYAIEKYL